MQSVISGRLLCNGYIIDLSIAIYSPIHSVVFFAQPERKTNLYQYDCSKRGSSFQLSSLSPTSHFWFLFPCDKFVFFFVVAVQSCIFPGSGGFSHSYYCFSCHCSYVSLRTHATDLYVRICRLQVTVCYW